ncbi:ExbD/TolR family protein [Granulosicoccus antarcticus]|nr:biopolymer transporter ExbD [Granulosicoccus antarcticus]
MMTDEVSFQFYQPRTGSLISLTPLIDVVFILLLFFMLASNFNVETSFSVQSAGNQSSATASTELASRVRLLGNDNFELDGQVLDRTGLIEALKQLDIIDAGRALSISVAEGTRVQELLELIALAERVGLTRVTMESLLP